MFTYAIIAEILRKLKENLSNKGNNKHSAPVVMVVVSFVFISFHGFSYDSGRYCIRKCGLLLIRWAPPAIIEDS